MNEEPSRSSKTSVKALFNENRFILCMKKNNLKKFTVWMTKVFAKEAIFPRII
jgi:hypothetical protein